MKKLLLLSTIAINGCTFGFSTPTLMNMDPPGPPEYKAGWKDGCGSGLATYGTAIYKMEYSFYQNYSMMKNPHYVAGWHEAFDYCRHYNLKWQTHEY